MNYDDKIIDLFEKIGKKLYHYSLISVWKYEIGHLEENKNLQNSDIFSKPVQIHVNVFFSTPTKLESKIECNINYHYNFFCEFLNS